MFSWFFDVLRASFSEKQLAERRKNFTSSIPKISLGTVASTLQQQTAANCTALVFLVVLGLISATEQMTLEEGNVRQVSITQADRKLLSQQGGRYKFEALLIL